MILLTKSSMFVNPDTGEHSGVYPVPKDKSKMVPMEYYVIGSQIYRFIGTAYSSKDVPCGSIYVLGGIYCIRQYETDDDKIKYGIENIVDRDEYEKKISSWKNKSIDNIASSYIDDYDDNVVDTNRSKLTNTGDVYIPELKDTDDPMERVIKLMIINMKLKLNESRSSFDKEYGLDNLRSALNGATKNMSILKFPMWCELLHCDWEFSAINGSDNVANPLPKPVTISNKKDLWVDIKDVPKGIFAVECKEGEDPLKRLIKVVIWNKQIKLKDYKSKGSTAHLINNLRSGLKGNQKQSIQGALAWAEILDFIIVIKITNVDTGVWYKIVGYDVYTNAPDDPNATCVE